MFKFDGKNIKLCACGCGKPVTKKDNKFLWGHNSKGIKCSIETKKKISKSREGIKFSEIHKRRIGEKSKGRVPPQKGKTLEEFYGVEKSIRIKESMRNKNSKNEKLKNRKGKLNPNYKGYYDCLYSNWQPKIGFVDKVRETIAGKIEVYCSYCGKWFIPTPVELENRYLNIDNDGCKLYCSEECKCLCPIYYQVLYPKGDKPYEKRAVEVDPNLRQMVFERDDWACQKCGIMKSLECHHIDPVSQEPMFANDMDSCITLCTKCHKEIHMNIKGCGYAELRKVTKRVCI